MRGLFTTFTVDTLNLDGLSRLTGLDFLDPADVADRELTGPFVYVLVDPKGAVVYPGKSEAAGNAVSRTLAYAKWASQLTQDVQDGGRPDPAHDPATGNLELVHYSPIVRSFLRYSLLVKTAQVPDGERAAVWEARIQALQGTLTTIESVIGGSGWEANPNTLRGDAYLWAAERIEQVRREYRG